MKVNKDITDQKVVVGPTGMLKTYIYKTYKVTKACNKQKV